MTRYKCLVNGRIEEPARAVVRDGLVRLNAERFGIDPAAVQIEFIEIAQGLWYTAGEPSTASMVLGTVPIGTTQEVRVEVMDEIARLFCTATGSAYDEVMVVAADADGGAREATVAAGSGTRGD